MRAALRDAKIVAAKACGTAKAEPKRLPWPGLLGVLAGMFGPPPVMRVRPDRRLMQRRARRLEMERVKRQWRHEAGCDERFHALQVAPSDEKPAGQLRRHWKREWLHAEALAEDARRSRRRVR